MFRVLWFLFVLILVFVGFVYDAAWFEAATGVAFLVSAFLWLRDDEDRVAIFLSGANAVAGVLLIVSAIFGG